jgi:phosphoglucosamine mutase
MPDNGIKFFATGGHKLDDAIEDAIEARLGEPWDRPLGAAVGRVQSDPGVIALYDGYLMSTLPNGLSGLSLVVDCANGAASTVAPALYARAGARVLSIHSSPDGLNINDNCGSTHLGDLIEAVLEHGADAGIAHDGDADRCLAVDGNGNVVDGDHILAILAEGMRDSGRLAHNTVVSTVMANLGFKIAMRTAQINVVETGVGDRYVLESMRENGYVLGGEQSGHVVMSEYANTGDGLLTALHLLARVVQTGSSLADLAARVTKLPQVLVNVEGVDKSRADSDRTVAAAVARASAELGDSGRVLLRPSGTEPVIRVMVEAASHEQAQRLSDELAAIVLAELAL